MDYSFHFVDENAQWNPEWGIREKFDGIAFKKLCVVKREKLPTSVVVAIKPWKLQEGEYLYSGGTTRAGISVAVSGAKGRTDEALAEIVLSTVIMLLFLEADQRVKANQMQI